MFEKLIAMAKQAQEDRGFRQLVQACHSLLSERGQANMYALADEVVQRWNSLSSTRYEAFFAVLATEFSPNDEVVGKAIATYLDKPNPDTLAKLSVASEAPRQELLRRINRTGRGTATLLAMRVALLACMRTRQGLKAVDSDFLHLLSSWFNPGFLRFEPVSWDSSAALLEKIIQHEAVHAIDSWTHLRRRLQSDRRCYAFFHPQLEGEPLIFVEVALTDAIPPSIAPLIDIKGEVSASTKPKVAVFYSISNCQPGLRGVSLGNFLIKRVAEHLAQELPSLKTYCTLSPVPGFANWFEHVDTDQLPLVQASHVRTIRQWQAEHAPLTQSDIGLMSETVTTAVQNACAYWLVHGSHQHLGDPVARFHLDNGARLERVNVAGDLSKKGIKQSLSVMVNYLYDLDKVESRHEEFVQGTVSHSSQVKKWLKA
jgi:malonyl-CoA decarboxylase